MGLLSFGDTFFALRFLRLLTTPWKKTGAYKAGIVDRDGKVLKKPEGKEKEVYNLFHKLVFNVKRLLNKLPFGKKTIASYAAALFLIKEHTGLSDELFGELLFETTGYNPNLDSLNESEQYNLTEGKYSLNQDLVLINGDILKNSSTNITVEEKTTQPIGHIFGHAIYRVLEERTQQLVLITKTNIE